MHINRFIILLIAFIYLLGVPVASASSNLETEFEMILPQAFQQNLIEQEWQALQKNELKMSWHIPDQVYDAPDVKVHLSGLLLDLKTKLKNPGQSQGAESITLESKDLQAELNIQAVTIDQYIEKEVGGVIGRFRIQARCEGIRLHMDTGKGSFAMKLSPSFEGSLVRAHVNDVSLSWTPDAWSLGDMKCTGAQGFDDIIKAEVLKLTGDSSIVDQQKDILRQNVQDYVNKYSIDLAQSRNLTSTRPDIKVSMRIREFAATEKKALVVRGIIRAEFMKFKGSDNIYLKLSKQSSKDDSSTNARLRIPEEFVLIMAKQAFGANSWLQRVYSSQLPGFSSLMQSRFSQFFIWCELMSFPKSAEFLFDTYSQKNIEVAGENLNYQVRASLRAEMYAPKNGRYIPFMNFRAPFSSQVQLSVKQGNVLAKFSAVSFDLQEQWEPLYIERYHPSQAFARNKINTRLEKAMEGFATLYSLPRIPLTDKIFLQLEKVQKSTQTTDLVFYLK